MEALALLLSPIVIFFLIILAVWDMVWKFIGLWKSARNNHLAWFICIAIFNTAGILPIVYVLMHKNKTSSSDS